MKKSLVVFLLLLALSVHVSDSYAGEWEYRNGTWIDPE